MVVLSLFRVREGGGGALFINQRWTLLNGGPILELVAYIFPEAGFLILVSLNMWHPRIPPTLQKHVVRESTALFWGAKNHIRHISSFVCSTYSTYCMCVTGALLKKHHQKPFNQNISLNIWILFGYVMYIYIYTHSYSMMLSLCLSYYRVAGELNFQLTPYLGNVETPADPPGSQL